MPDPNVFDRMAKQSGPPRSGQPAQASPQSQANVFYRMAEAQGSGGQPDASAGADAPGGLSPGFLSNWSDVSGAGRLLDDVMHPIDKGLPDLKTVADAGRRLVASGQPAKLSDNPNGLIAGVGRMVDSSRQNFRQGLRDLSTQGLTSTTRRDFGRAVPVAGSLLDRAQTLQDAGDTPGALGTLAGGVTGFLAPEAFAKGTGLAVKPLRAVAGAARERIGGYTSPVIAPELQQASKIAKAIGSPAGPAHGLEQTIADQMPAIKAHAEATGNPMHSQWEVAQAARGSAQAGLDQFNAMLEPFANDRVAVGRGNAFQGFTGPQPGAPRMMTLGQINGRIGAINDLLRPAYNAKTAGATMTALERSGLQNELSFLRGKLYSELGARAGMSPADVQSMREAYGGQFAIADAVDAARRARLGQMGMAAEGGTTLPTSKVGLLDRAVTTLRGGREFLANRAMRNALQPDPFTLGGQASAGMLRGLGPSPAGRLEGFLPSTPVRAFPGFTLTSQAAQGKPVILPQPKRRRP